MNYSSTTAQDAKAWLLDALAQLKLPASFEEQKLTAEASHRSFSRLSWPEESEPKTLIYMQSPPALERNDAFVGLATDFGAAGIPVPKVLAHNPEHGWLLLTDVGDRDFFAAYAGPDQAAAIHSAIALLPRLQAFRSPDLMVYDQALVTFELSIFHEWFIGELLGQPAPPVELEPTWSMLATNFFSQPQVCVHLDYHCRNLLFSPEGNLGVVDFQDARLGPLTYDLASLLRDCYYRLPEPLVEQAMHQFAGQLDGAGSDLPALWETMELTAIQRQLKAIGIFARLQLRDDKTTHLQHILPTLDSLNDMCGKYPQTKDLQRYLTSLREPATKKLAQLQAIKTPETDA